jgi:hypothetical protein
MEAGQISALYMEVTTIGNPEPTRDEACGHESGVASAERHGEHAGREERVGQHQLACRSPGGPPAGIDMSMNTLIDPGGPQVSSAHNQLAGLRGQIEQRHGGVVRHGDHLWFGFSGQQGFQRTLLL